MSDAKSTRRAPLAVVGLGNMGSAVLQGAIDAAVLTADQILVCDPNEARTGHFVAMGCRAIPLEEVGRADAALLAVKPQIFPEIALGLAPHRDTMLISLMAGTSIDRIERMLGRPSRVVRTMPNTPALIGGGMTAICSNAATTAADLEFAIRLFEAVGTVVEVEESAMHAVTATSGSGPAWVYRLVEAWIAAAEREGLSPEIAERLVVETLVGSARLLKETDRDVRALRGSVTSKGGTTAAGLEAMDRLGFDDAVAGAIAAATRRGREIERSG